MQPNNTEPTDPQDDIQGLVLQPKLYNSLKFVALVLLPAIASFLIALSPIWSIPHIDQIIKTIVAFDAFLGFLVKFASDSAKKSPALQGVGTVVVTTDQVSGKKMVSLELNSDPDPEKIAKMQSMVFKVRSE